MAENAPHLQFLLDEAAAEIDVHAELAKIIQDVKSVRAGSVQQAAAAVKSGQAPGVVDIGAAIVKRVLLKEHDLPHVKIAVFEIRGHAVYEVVLKSRKAQQTHPPKIQGILKTGLGSAFEDHPCQGWRDEWLPLVWGVWIQQAFNVEKDRPYFTLIVPKSIDDAFGRA